MYFLLLFNDGQSYANDIDTGCYDIGLHGL